jgi:very-short-patch-repair endonuclease
MLLHSGPPSRIVHRSGIWHPRHPAARDTAAMRTVAQTVVDHGLFLRRRDLLGLGYTDGSLTSALEAGRIFRVRHGWYSVPSAPEAAIEAVRVGGRLTGLSALESYGIAVPRAPAIRIAVARNACRLRSPTDRRARLRRGEGRDIHWSEAPDAKFRGSRWRVSVGEALADVIRTELRDVVVACCDLVIPGGWMTARGVDALFDAAPTRAVAWRRLLDGRSESHGESFVRLWLDDAGIAFEPQPRIEGVGRLDGRVSPRLCVEVDGSQHAEASSQDAGKNQFEEDHRRDVAIVFADQRSLRFTYRQLHLDWERCLAAIRRLLAEEARIAQLERDSAVLRKRRRSERLRRLARASPP